MFCESYQRRLMDAAVLGGDLPPELELHLRECEGCAEEFATERALFAAMDGELRRSVEGEAPASLVAGVRAAVAEQAGPERRVWQSWILLPVGVGVMAAAALLFVSRNDAGKVGKGIEPVAVAKTAAVLATEEAPRTGAQPKQTVSASGRAKRPESLRMVPAVAEVKVQPTAETAMLQLIRVTREQPEAVRPMIGDGGEKSLLIQPIDVAELGWAPLTDSGADKN